MTPRHVAEAFSGHRFDEVYHRLSAHVLWVLPGHQAIEGKDAVIAACESSSQGMSQLAHTEFTRFVSVGDDRIAAVDVIARYVDHDGSTSVVSSADIYEFDGDGMITRITSYAVELVD